MKKILCFFMVALLAALLVVPCFAAETTAAPSDPVDWFGGTTQVLSGYSISYDYPNNTYANNSQVSAWLQAAGAVSTDTAIGSFNGYRFSGDSFTGVPARYYSATASGIGVIINGSIETAEHLSRFSATVNSLDGYSEAQAITGAVVIGIYSTVGANGFVDSGVSDALSELSIIVSAILSNQYILISIGLAVAVPLVAWGISKIKSLVKGY